MHKKRHSEKSGVFLLMKNVKIYQNENERND